MWEKVKTFCLNSATIAWSYVLAIAGSLLQIVDSAGDALGDPTFKDTLHDAIGDAKTVGRILLGVSIINIIARMRSLKKGP